MADLFSGSGESTFFSACSARILYFCMNPLSRTATAGSDAVSINIRSRSARAKQYSERSIGLAVLYLGIEQSYAFFPQITPPSLFTRTLTMSFT